MSPTDTLHSFKLSQATCWTWRIHKQHLGKVHGGPNAHHSVCYGCLRQRGAE